VRALHLIGKLLLAAFPGFVAVVVFMFSDLQAQVDWAYVFASEAAVFAGGGLLIGLLFPRT
jgi:hypothetical protein